MILHQTKRAFSFTLSLCILAATLACSPARNSPPSPAPETPSAQLSQGPSYDKLVEVAHKLALLGKAEKAKTYAQEAAALNAKRGGAWGVLGLLAAQRQDLPEALKLYEQAIQLGCTSRHAYAELGSIYDVSKRYQQAVDTYGAWLQKSPLDHDLRHQMALSLVMQGNTGAAIQELGTLVGHVPQEKMFQMDLAYAQLQHGDLDAALKQFEMLQPEGAAPSLDYSLVVAVVRKMSDPRQASAFVQRFAAPGSAKEKLLAHLKTLH